MPQLEVHLTVEGESEPVTYLVDGDLKRPGEAIQSARERASEDGHENPRLDEVKLAEPA
jgi:hypothetical protein